MCWLPISSAKLKKLHLLPSPDPELGEVRVAAVNSAIPFHGVRLATKLGTGSDVYGGEWFP